MKAVEQTKKLISDNGSYRVYAELHEFNGDLSNDVDLKTKMYNLKFKTVWNGAENPVEEHLKFEMFLNDEQLKKLKELL